MSSKTTQNVNSIVATIISVSVNIIIIAIVAMCVYTFGIWAYNFGTAVFSHEPVDKYNGKSVIVTIPTDASSMDVSDIMKKAGLVEDKYVFMVQIILSDQSGNIAAGTYTLSTDMTPDELIAAIIEVPEEEE